MMLEDLRDEYDRLKGIDFDLLNNEQKGVYTADVLVLLGDLQSAHREAEDLLPLVYALE